MHLCIYVFIYLFSPSNQQVTDIGENVSMANVAYQVKVRMYPGHTSWKEDYIPLDVSSCWSAPWTAPNNNSALACFSNASSMFFHVHTTPYYLCFFHIIIYILLCVVHVFIVSLQVFIQPYNTGINSLEQMYWWAKLWRWLDKIFLLSCIKADYFCFICLLWLSLCHPNTYIVLERQHQTDFTLCFLI